MPRVAEKRRDIADLRSRTVRVADVGIPARADQAFGQRAARPVEIPTQGAGVAPWVIAGPIAFSRSKRVCGVLDLDGTVVNASDVWTAVYHAERVLAPDSLARAAVQNPGTGKLLSEIAKASGGKQASRASIAASTSGALARRGGAR